MAGIEIERMSPAELDAACEVIGLAFADNPNTLAVVRGDEAKARRMTQVAVRAAKLGRAASHVLVAKEGGRVVGVLNAAEWPRCQLGAGEKLRIAPAMIRVAGLALARSMKLMRVWAEHDPRKPHWHLGPIGVHPRLQGRGIGKALLKAFLRTVDERASAAYLETDVDRNVALYEKFGFSVVARAEIMGIDNRFMWREPAPLDDGLEAG